MRKPKVSIVVPIFNAERYLGLTLESILTQNLKDFELILINDGSTDSSLQICNEYALKDPRIQIISQPNMGFGPARNTGLQNAKGEYLYFMDSDDLIESSLLEDNYEIAKNDNADTVIFGHRKIYSSSKVVNSVDMIPPRFSGASADNIVQLLELGFCFAVWEQLIRREVVIQNKLTFPSLKREADIAFLLEFYTFCEVISSNSTIYYHYNSFYSSNKFNLDSLENHKILFERLMVLAERKSRSEPRINQLKIKFFVLWFCHVIPLNYVNSTSLSRRDKLIHLKNLLTDAKTVAWAKEFKIFHGTPIVMRVSLFIYQSQMPLLMYCFARAKAVIKKYLRMNFKKFIYR
jgi:glycosyltransferase involved in cell wall biosynthesis